ncbi:uracil-DNA glycosylase [Pseudarthrobacter sp. efr-133-R2A-89]|uniref:uracil-DNA glycosylase n=1 Tax=Pseudarthrobacter sp. efr-133-R2A-89 TaxID=3040302 RepID=UPI002555B275|nr:uracil-DNA glycosylase [Pseudarthrobacter sp. efr-133-R2A-89]
MRSGSGIKEFVERLAATETGPACTNFFSDAVPENALRRRNLEIYLQEMRDRQPGVLLVGEAPGFRGMRITGVPFTNRTILEGPANSFGLFGPGKGYVVPPEAVGVAAEPTATVLWQVLEEVNFLPLLWSAFPWHPHQPGKPWSNRTPKPSETKLGTLFWQELAGLFGISSIVAVGNVAQNSLQRSGVSAPKIRHPAHGGRSGFKQGLQELLAAGG